MGGILWTFFYLHHINLHGNSSTPYHLLDIIFWPNLKPGFHDYYKPFYDVEDSPGCKPTKDSKGTMCLAALVLKLKNGGQKTWFSLALLGMTAGHTKKGSKSEELFTFGNSLKKGERGAQKDLLSRWCFPPFMPEAKNLVMRQHEHCHRVTTNIFIPIYSSNKESKNRSNVDKNSAIKIGSGMSILKGFKTVKNVVILRV